MIWYVWDDMIYVMRYDMIYRNYRRFRDSSFWTLLEKGNYRRFGYSSFFAHCCKNGIIADFGLAPFEHCCKNEIIADLRIAPFEQCCKKPEKSRQDFWKNMQKTNTKNTDNMQKWHQHQLKSDIWAPPGRHRGHRPDQENSGFRTAKGQWIFSSFLAPFWTPLGTPWESPGRPRRSKNTPRSGKRRVQERSKKNSWKKVLSRRALLAVF